MKKSFVLIVEFFSIAILGIFFYLVYTQDGGMSVNDYKIRFQNYDATIFEDIDSSADNKHHSLIEVKLKYDILTKEDVKDANKDRFILREIHSSKNQEIVDLLKLYYFENLYVSEYLPVVTFEYEYSDSNDLYKEFEDITSSEYVEHILVHADASEIIDYVPNDSFSKSGIADMNNYNSMYNYSGDNVVVAVWEHATIDPNHPNFVGKTVIVKPTALGDSNTEPFISHANLVASIIGGNTGIAKDVTLLSVNHSYFIFDKMDWMLANDVNIINMSFSFGTTIDGYSIPFTVYDNNTEYLDYTVKTYGVTIVKSAGNNTTFISTPGWGNNIITVGSINYYNEEISNFSAYLEYELNAPKPNLVAQGQRVYVSGTLANTGTSFSAPQVTGAIALMMEKDSALKSSPELVNAILLANSSMENVDSQHYTFDENGMSNKAGAGVMQIDKNLENIHVSELIDDYSSFNEGDLVFQSTFYAEGNKRISFSYSHTIIPSYNMWYSPNYDKFSVLIRNSNGDIVKEIETSNSNYGKIVFTPHIPSTYTIELYLKEDFQNDDNNALAVAMCIELLISPC